MDLRKELKEIVEQETVELFGINEDEFTDRLVGFVKDNFTEKVNNGVLDDVIYCGCDNIKIDAMDYENFNCLNCNREIKESCK